MKLRRGYSREANDALGVDPLELVAETYGFHPADLGQMLVLMKTEKLTPIELIQAMTDDEYIPARETMFESNPTSGNYAAH